METERQDTDEDHLRDDERGSDGGSAPRARSRDRAGRSRPSAARYPLSSAAARSTPPSEFDDASPIDTRILLGPLPERQARARARGDRRGDGRVPGMERRGRGASASRCCRRWPTTIRAHRWELSALMGYEAGKNRLECVGDVEESADLIEYYCDQVEEHHGFETHAGHARARRREPQRAAAVRRVGRDLAVQLPAGARRRPRRRRAGRRQHGRVQAGVSDTPLLGYKLYEVMTEAGIPPGVFNFVTGGGSTAGQELIDNAGIDGIVFTGSKDVGHAPDPRQRDAAGAAAAHHRDGRQESGDRHAVGRSRQGDRRRHAIGVRRAGPEVLRLLARLRVARRFATSSSSCSSRRRRRSRSATRSNRDV